jgi:prefoldin alpha subunit
LEKKRLASKQEEELRKLTGEMRYLEQTAEAIQARLNMVSAVATDLAYAKMTLDTLEKEKPDSDLLVPIGGSSFIKAKLACMDKITVGIGAGVSVEKTLPEAKEIVQKRLEDLEKTRNSLQQQFTEVAQKINEDREKFEHLIAEVRQGKASENV